MTTPEPPLSSLSSSSSCPLLRRWSRSLGPKKKRKGSSNGISNCESREAFLNSTFDTLTTAGFAFSATSAKEKLPVPAAGSAGGAARAGDQTAGWGSVDRFKGPLVRSIPKTIEKPPTNARNTKCLGRLIEQPPMLPGREQVIF